MSAPRFDVPRLRLKLQEISWKKKYDSPVTLENAIESNFWKIPEIEAQESNSPKKLSSETYDEKIGSITGNSDDDLFERLSQDRVSAISSDEKLPKQLIDGESVRTADLTFTTEESGSVGRNASSAIVMDEYDELDEKDDIPMPVASSFTSFKNCPNFEVIHKPVPLTSQEIPRDTVGMPFYFAEVASPIHFWFHITEYVLTFSKSLDRKYKGIQKNELNIDDTLIQPGMLIACLPPSFGAWHRGKVLTPLNDKGLARVFLFDYGTIGMISRDNMKFLLREFAEFPKCSNRGRIPNLVPFNSITFSVQNVRKMFDKFNDKRLEGKVLRYDEKGDFYELELYYKDSDGIKRNVRDWIIENNIASELGAHDVLPLCYHLPTFELLENEYPTFTELDFLEQHHGIDMETNIRTNFLANNVEEESRKNPKLFATLGNRRLRDVKEYYFNS